MSKYGVSITELKEEKYLVDALREMGYRKFTLKLGP